MGRLDFKAREQPPARRGFSSILRFNEKELYPQKDGLSDTYINSCGFITLGGTTRYQLVPSNPNKGQQIPLYSCAKTLYGADTVATTEETITVPAGTFKTFSIAHFNGDRSWWEQATGLVQYETSMLWMPVINIFR